MSLSEYGTVKSATKIAVEAHEGQKDLAGEPYIKHVFRVADMMEDDMALKVAYLHDVVEDSDMLLSDIEAEFGAEVCQAVQCLTRIDGEDYKDYIEQLCDNQLAMQVKLADLRDHLGPERHASLRPESYDKYWTAFWRIVQEMLKNAEKEKNHASGTIERVDENRSTA